MSESGGRAPSTNGALGKIEAALQSRLEWMLFFIAEDQSDKLATLVEDLKRDPCSLGNGKRFASGFSYWGISPTVAWTRACSDPWYLVMKLSITAFPPAWHRTLGALGKQPYHYVSLGIGTGQKDHYILKDLLAANPDMCFVPIDMSATMLRIGIQAATKDLEIARSNLVPIEIDFSLPGNVAELSGMLRSILGDEPILFSLLGNTLANFESDGDALRILTELLRPQDRLLLEVARTENVTEDIANAAAIEYSRGEEFRRFVVSALLQNTDLHVDAGSVEFVGEPESERVIRVKVLYRNKTGENMIVTMPNGHQVTFAVDDTIRLYLSRKYTPAALAQLIGEAGLKELHHETFHFPKPPFGIELMLLERSAVANTAAFDVFIAHANHEPDNDVAEQLYRRLSPHCRVFLDAHALKPSEHWDAKLADAQNQSMITVVIVTPATLDHHYTRDEIARGLNLKHPTNKHLVIPVWVHGRPSDPKEIPYGLDTLTGISLPEAGIDGTADRIIEHLRELRR